ncbi:arad-like aldolase/epimerase [Marasmius fiardii PR-910]|nr:arad-like aldolase/epimerase [Marasmius fiardii PR-910]
MAPQPNLHVHDDTPHGVDAAEIKSKTHAELSSLPSEKPIDRLWRGDRAGNVKLDGLPTFDDPYKQREWIKEHMAAAFRYWGKLGFGEGASGHITVRDPVLPDHYWMNPFAVHFSSMTKSKLVLVRPDGYVSPHGAQRPINTAGYWIHSAIHKARPEAMAIAHCHSINASAWSAFGLPIDILQQDASIFYDNLSVYNEYSGIVLASEEGENIAKALGKKNRTCILRNHGLVTLGSTVDEAVYTYGLLDKHCKIQLMVEAAAVNGLKKIPISAEDAKYNAEVEADPESLYIAFQPEYELLVEETNGAFLK